jgi:hypothetical protein
MKRLFCALASFAIPTFVCAANPTQVELGLQLFTQNFTSTPLGLNGDGLGPVFNEASCVACHNVGGVGGSGDVRSNARSVGMQELFYEELDPIGMNREREQWQARQRIGSAGREFDPRDRRMIEAVTKV